MPADFNDPRWGGYVPWFLRHSDFAARGDFATFFSHLSQRLKRLFEFNECGVQFPHFGSRLETESLQRFKYDGRESLATSIHRYFSPDTLDYEVRLRIRNDETKLRQMEEGIRILGHALHPPRTTLAPGRDSRIQPIPAKDRAKAEEEYANMKARAETLRTNATHNHYSSAVIERIGVLEALLRILPTQTSWHAALIQDILRFFAASQVMLTIQTDDGFPLRIVPLDEPLLQTEVVDKLLPRLFEKFPDRARELVSAYHDLIGGKDGDSIFAEAFKTLEQLARDVTLDSGFVFDESHLDKHFPLLHSTIHQTLIRLGGHRGDKAGHGKDAPPPHEIRYLLFAICNAALLLLDYPGNSTGELKSELSKSGAGTINPR
jgi:hypothetical protein